LFSQASNDGASWTTLKEHINDDALKLKGATHTWDLPVQFESYQYFRIMQTGLNSNNHEYLALRLIASIVSMPAVPLLRC
jgi:hypothetical protein